MDDKRKAVTTKPVERNPITNAIGPLTLRLRPGTDNDIIDALDKMPAYVNRSEILRLALRNYIPQMKTLE